MTELGLNIYLAVDLHMNAELINLFRDHVPEIADGSVSIQGIAHAPGYLAIVSVRSSDSSIDALNACIGFRGARINAICQTLSEKIDLVLWTDSADDYVRRLFVPAILSGIEMDDLSGTMNVFVPPEQRPLAIGREGRRLELIRQLVDFPIVLIEDR